METKCYRCETAMTFDSIKVMRSDECPQCYAYVRVCKMCDFYDPHAYNECRETMAERIVNKEKVNFCNHFTLGVPDKKKKDDLLSAAEALFKK